MLPINAIPKPITSYTTSLAADLEASSTSLTVNTATDDAGNAISGVVGLTIGGEFIVGTKSGTTVSSLLRGIDPQDGTTERTTLKAKHLRGTPVVVTDAPFLCIAYRLLNGDEGFPNKLKYAAATLPTYGQYELAAWDYVKDYADALAIAGAPDMDEITKGLGEAATQAESDAGDDTGTTTAPTVLRPSKAANSVQRGVWVNFTETATGDDSYTATTAPAFVPAAGSFVFGSFAVGNTGGASFALNGETPVAIQKVVSGALGALETGDIIASTPVFLYRTATVWVLLSPCGTIPTTATMSEMAAFFSSTDMTGAEAEDLTDGGKTVLHTHVPIYQEVRFNSPTIFGGTASNFDNMQAAMSPDSSKLFVAVGRTYNSGGGAIDLWRFDADPLTGVYVFVATVTATAGSFASGTKRVGIYADATYVYLTGINNGSSDLAIVRFAHALSGETLLTNSGTAFVENNGRACGTATDIYVHAGLNSTKVGHWTISGTTATRTTDITLSQAPTTDVFAMHWDGTNFFTVDAGNVVKKFDAAGTLVTTGSAILADDTLNASLASLADGVAGVSFFPISGTMSVVKYSQLASGYAIIKVTALSK